MRAFEEGVQLVRVCHKKLDEVEKRVELLLKDDAGRFFTRPFPEGEGEELKIRFGFSFLVFKTSDPKRKTMNEKRKTRLTWI